VGNWQGALQTCNGAVPMLPMLPNSQLSCHYSLKADYFLNQRFTCFFTLGASA